MLILPAARERSGASCADALVVVLGWPLGGLVAAGGEDSRLLGRAREGGRRGEGWCWDGRGGGGREGEELVLGRAVCIPCRSGGAVARLPYMRDAPRPRRWAV